MFALPAKTPTETVVVTFDFTDEFPSGTSLSNGTVAKSSISGSDTTAAGLTLGAIVYSGLKMSVVVSAGTDANVYGLNAGVDGSDGQHRERQCSLRVSVDASK